MPMTKMKLFRSKVVRRTPEQKRENREYRTKHRNDIKQHNKQYYRKNKTEILKRNAQRRLRNSRGDTRKSRNTFV